MKLLQVLISVCATFWGFIFALEELGIAITMELTLYKYLLLALGMLGIMTMPFHLASRNKEVIGKSDYEIEKPLIHRLLEEEMESHEYLSVDYTKMKKQKEGLFLTVMINVEKVEKLNVLEKTKELTKAFNERLKGLFGEDMNYSFHFVYKATK